MEKDTCAPRQQHSGGAPEELALRGGLQGRMAGGFGALQSSVDALQRYLACNAPPQLRQTALDLLDDMTGRIAQLYRLSCNAARLAAGAGMRGADEAAPLELSGYLSALAGCANEELAMRGFAARIRLEGAGPLWVLGSASLLDGIFTNLLSNLLCARTDGEMLLTLSPDRTLRYADNGPGMDPAAARALLEQGRPAAELLDRGALGLLLVRDYAAALGWQITVEQGAGLRLCFRLPPQPDPAGLVLQDSAGDAVRRGILAADLRRELDGVFGTPPRRP